ncbi:MAG: glycoside hydrolase family 15 protein [Sciscionella sp.]
MPAEDAVDIDAEFPPQVLREYALLADGERGALIGPHGDIAWLCAPRWDSDGVFSSLIGGGGAYAVTPRDVRHVWGGYYEPGSLIWRSHWVTSDGMTECREALSYPGDTDRLVLLRRVVACDGAARVRVLLDPRAGFGRHASTDLGEDDGVFSGRSGPLRWRWTGAQCARKVHTGHDDGAALEFELTVPEGAHHDLILELSEHPLPAKVPDADLAWEATEAAWQRTAIPLDRTIAPRDARHATAVLRGLTSSGGGMVAAATTSLPERAGTGRNYDYRYAWIRDQSYAGMAAATAGGTDLLDAAVDFVGARLIEDGAALKPAYTVDGGAVPSEQKLQLPGYPGGTDKLGNWVNKQFQLDAFGEALQLLATAGHQERLDAQGWRAIRTAVAAVEARWRDPEAGIWELDDRRWTQSRLACIAGLRSVASLPDAGRDRASYSALADAILADTSANSLHADGHWQRSPGDTELDASLLLPPLRGALPASDPRTIATRDAVRQRLAREGYVYRFRHDDRDLGDAEGAFLLCGFMMALAEHQQGNEVAAGRYFDRNRTSCGQSGLFSEEYDITQRQLRGNLPQAFVHALLLECAATLTD